MRMVARPYASEHQQPAPSVSASSPPQTRLDLRWHHQHVVRRAGRSCYPHSRRIFLRRRQGARSKGRSPAFYQWLGSGWEQRGWAQIYDGECELMPSPLQLQPLQAVRVWRHDIQR
uniref:Uncharacterized protein n=1 Tax=Arundo donax TaxID=35708 RepID=A0A0A9HS76_ARUDO